MIILILFAFLAGIVTILSPCILPILPIVLSGSVGGKTKPLGIVTGFVASFTFFTLTLATLVKALGIPADSLRTVAVIILIFFGLSLVIPKIQVQLEKILSALAQRGQVRTQGDGFLSGIPVGASLGLVWAPCVGPILASVITLAATSSVSFATVLITLAYTFGTAIPMLVITYSGRYILVKVPWLQSRGRQIQQGFGVIMVLTALGIAFNVDRSFQSYILEKFPQYGVGLTSFEDNAFVKKQLEGLKNMPASATKGETKKMDEAKKAPEIDGGIAWINSEPLSLEQLRGKVVLVDFWTYSCINCIRTLPYLRDWWDKYRDSDFVIIGVHSPEFAFERELANVQQAVRDFEITYPVVLDNDFTIWNAYDNRFWPAKYLVDKEGNIRYMHFGEGKYQETEQMIASLLDEEALPSLIEEKQSSLPRTPETYLGYQRAGSYLREQNIAIDQEKRYQNVNILPNDAVALAGAWVVSAESVTAQDDSAVLFLNYLGTEVNLVMHPAGDKPGVVTVLVDGQPVPSNYITPDYNQEGVIEITEPKLYGLVNSGDDYGRHTLEIHFSEGVSAFAFTFGS